MLACERIAPQDDLVVRIASDAVEAARDRVAADLALEQAAELDGRFFRMLRIDDPRSRREALRQAAQRVHGEAGARGDEQRGARCDEHYRRATRCSIGRGSAERPFDEAPRQPGE
ncbi:hypothetical protein GCM10011404_16090 [Sphingomonas prati]|nr:hypothetical protein GCM10011404_16090 [Sphingomonas prati]